MTHDYKFDNTTHLNDDDYSISERTLQNKNYHSYLTTNYNTSNTTALAKSLDQPNIFIKGSYGNVGRNVDEYSNLRNGAVQTTVPCKLSLQERLFRTVPYLGKGTFNPDKETELIHSEYVDQNKSINTVTDKQFTTLYTPLLPEIKKTITNPQHLVEEHVDKNWIRGGIPTRDAYKNKKYNE
jgi:hypothetical protein